MNIKKYIPKPIKVRLVKVKKYLTNSYFRADELLNPSKMKYYCPCCNLRFRSFQEGNFRSRTEFFNPERYKDTEQEVVCPVCGTIPRHRILALWMKKHISELKGDILYFAPEKGMELWLKRNKISHTTADLFNSADLKLDIEHTGQPDCSWDWVVCNHVLEHVNDYQQALREIYRILKPGGTLICSFPILEYLPTVIEESEHTEENKAKRIQLYGQADHLRIFGADSDKILKKAGFQVSRIDGNRMPEAILPIVGPADYDVNFLFVCRKKK